MDTPMITSFLFSLWKNVSSIYSKIYKYSQNIDYSGPFLITFFLYVWVQSSRDGENRLVKNILKKWRIFAESILFMIWSKDNKGIGPKKNPDPDLIKNLKTRTKTVVFIRHGESDWNNVFNKGINLSFPGRLIGAIMDELKLMFTPSDSKFLDSPLNHEGIDQALELRKFIESTTHPECSKKTLDVISIMRGESEITSLICSSTLRRAIATTTLSLWPRIVKHSEKVWLLSSLQEISRNIDTRALAGALEIADLPFSRIQPHCLGHALSNKSSKTSSKGNNTNSEFNAESVYELSKNQGNKRRDFYGIKRLQTFNEWIFEREEETILVGGHSLWFKSFFQTYMPHASNHDAKNKKIANSGVVVFTLHRAEDNDANGNPQYRVDPDSIECIYGGFTTK